MQLLLSDTLAKTSIRTVLLALAGLVTLAPLFERSSMAQDEAQVQVRVGIDDNYAAGTWTPVTLQIGSEISRMAPLDIDLTMSMHGAGRMKTLRRYSTSLPRHEGKTATELSIPVYLTRNSNHILVQISKEGRQILDHGVFLNRMESPTKMFILILTSRPENFNIIPSIKMRFDTKTIFLPPEKLGEDWTFYHALDCVIIDDVGLASLTEEQFDALRTWLYRGGNLLFTASGLELNAEGQRFRSLADIQFKGQRGILSPSTLSVFYNEEQDLVVHVDSLEVVADERDIFLKTKGTPLILRHEAGLGCLWALTFHPEKLSLRDRRRFDPLVRKIWTSILERSESNEGELRWRRAVAVAPEAEMEKVSGPVAAYLLILVVVLGPLNFVLLKKLDKREYILLTVPVVTLLLGIAAFGAGLALKGNRVVKVARTLTMGNGGDSIFDHRQYLGILSPKKDLFRLSASDATGRMPHVLEPIMLESWNELKKVGRFPLQIEYLDGELRVSDIEMPMWGMEFLQLVSVTKHEEALNYSLRLEQDRVVGHVKNGLPFALKQCFIISRYNKLPLGDLEPNERKEFGLKILPPPSLDDVKLTSYEKEMARQSIFHKIFWDDTRMDDKQLELLEQAFRSYQEHFEDTVLIGWADSAPTTRTAAEGLQASEIESHLMVFKLPLLLKEKQISVPIGLSRRKCFGERWWRNPFALSAKSYADASLELDLPFNAHEEFEIEELTVHMSRPALKDFTYAREEMKEPALAVSIYNWTDDKWTQLVSTTQREVHHQVGDEAEKHVKFPQGLIRLKVELTDAGHIAPYFSPGQFFDLYSGAMYFDPDRISRLSTFDGVPLTFLDVSLKGQFPES